MKKPLSVWIKKIKFVHTVWMGSKSPKVFEQKVMCLIWKPEFYEPKFLRKQGHEDVRSV